MLKATHQEGGRTGCLLSTLVVFITYPFPQIDYLLVAVCLIIIANVTIWASTMSDLDHNENAMPTKGIISYIVYSISHKVDPTHRSVFTHCPTVPIVLFGIPTILIHRQHFQIENYSSELVFLAYTTLVAMFTGSIMHIILDRFTVDGSYKSYAILVFIWCKITGKDFKKVRSKMKTTLVVKNLGWVLTTTKPYIKKIDLKDYGRTGGKYEDTFRYNLETLNYLLVSLALVISVRPDFSRCFAYITKLLTL